MKKLQIKNNFVLAPLALFVSCVDPDPLSLEGLYIEDGRYVDSTTSEPLTGPAVRMSSNNPSQVEMEVNLLNGFLHGPYTIFDPELYYVAGPLRTDRGALVIEDSMYEVGNFDQGVKSGAVTIYHGDGNVFRSVTYLDDMWHGPFREYRKNGELTMQANFEEDKMHGNFETYWLNDEILRKGAYNHGERCGIWLDYGNNNQYEPCPKF